MKTGLRAATICFILLSGWIARIALAQPLVVEQLTLSTTGGTARGWLAIVDLTDARIDIVTDPQAPAGTGANGVLQATDAWRSANGCRVAINANYFGTVSATAGDIIGLHASDGVIVSPARQYGTSPDPAIAFDKNRVPRIGYIAPNDTTGVWDAVAGVGPSASDNFAGTLLVTNGTNTGASARVDPLNRNPRTAIGVNAAGTTLYLLVIDGRQTGWSVGMTNAEVATYLISRGVWNAVNLDGGGSSSFVWLKDDGTTAVNRPSDGVFRGVPSHLGIRLRQTPATTYRTTRPIRGVKLRPPDTLTGPNSFETAMQQATAAGLTDVWLETFYWGVSTGKQGVFNSRFGYDYLAQAIPIAAKYNIRVHAWLETGYWQFGTTGAYNFTLNVPGESAGDPAWKVVHTNSTTLTGDSSGQVFANLIHPGVRAKLSSYVAELATYPGLWSMLADYARFPVDDNTGDVYPAPYSYDDWTRATFQSLYGSDPQVTARRTNGAQWNNFLAWRRAGIGQTVQSMYQSVKGARSDMVFMCDVPPAPATDSAQLAKCQDWTTWASSGWLDVVSPMCYSSTTSSIVTEIVRANGLAAGKPMLIALALTGTASHPSITEQMNMAKQQGVEDWVLFNADVFADPARQSELKAWIVANATAQQSDFNNDDVLDYRDLLTFNTRYRGTPIAVTPLLARYDMNNDGWIDETDKTLVYREFAKYRFGEDGVVNQYDLDAFLACVGATGPSGSTVAHMYDLNGDGVVNYADQLILQSMLTVALPPDTDVNRDGVVDIEDLYRQTQSPIDVNRDGKIDAADTARLESVLRANEIQDMSAGRR